jgi:hypothetical protein
MLDKALDLEYFETQNNAFIQEMLYHKRKGSINMVDTKFKFKEFVDGIAGACLISAALLTPFLMDWRTRWGATDAEVNLSLPGDDFVPHPKWGWTHAITIRASAAEVWPWLVQMGQGRGGMYSYEWLENLVGCDIHNADRIIPEFQHLEVGDGIWLHPKVSIPITAIEPCRALVLHVRTDTQTGSTFELTDTMPEKYIDMSWEFFLDEHDEGTTRLISRWRGDYNPSLGNAVIYRVFTEPISFVMDRKMLRGIKRRAEAAALP